MGKNNLFSENKENSENEYSKTKKQIKPQNLNEFFLKKEQETGNVISTRTRELIAFTMRNKPGKTPDEIWRMIYGD